MHPSGDRLQLLRFRAGLTQAELAERAHLSVNYISELERGAYAGRVKTWRKLALALNVEIRDFEPLEETG